MPRGLHVYLGEYWTAFGLFLDILVVLGGMSDAEDVHDVQEELDDDGEWPSRLTIKLIEMWRERKFLYDNTHKWYARRDKKQEAFEAMANDLKCSGKLYRMI